MTLTESELLQARIAGMSNLEFDEWLAEDLGMRNDAFDEGYREGKEAAKNDYSQGWDDGYEEGYDNGVNE